MRLDSSPSLVSYYILYNLFPVISTFLQQVTEEIEAKCINKLLPENHHSEVTDKDGSGKQPHGL